MTTPNQTRRTSLERETLPRTLHTFPLNVAAKGTAPNSNAVTAPGIPIVFGRTTAATWPGAVHQRGQAHE